MRYEIVTGAMTWIWLSVFCNGIIWAAPPSGYPSSFQVTFTGDLAAVFTSPATVTWDDQSFSPFSGDQGEYVLAEGSNFFDLGNSAPGSYASWSFNVSVDGVGDFGGDAAWNGSQFSFTPGGGDGSWGVSPFPEPGVMAFLLLPIWMLRRSRPRSLNQGGRISSGRSVCASC